MSFANEIRAALQQRPDATAADLWRLCPSAENAQQFTMNVTAFINRGEVIAPNVPGRARRYTLNPDFVAPKPGRRRAAVGGTLKVHLIPVLTLHSWEALVRPGGLDYRKYPSFAGGQRIPYHLP